MFDEIILQAAAIGITALIGWGAALIQRKTGYEVEAKHRETLHSALMTGAKLAVARNLTGAAALQLIKQVARQGASDALKYFDLERKVQVLDDLAESKLQEWIGIQVDLPIDEFITRDRLVEELEKILGPEAVRKQ